MLYKGLKFPKRGDRPIFYTNFVQTVDGKTAVKAEGYWPIGSKKDYQVLLELRGYADALIHGANLAREFGTQTLESLSKEDFKKLREKLGRNSDLPYYIVTKKPNLYSRLTGGNIIAGDLQEVLDDLKKQGYENVLVEGGPTLLGSFLKENLLDEIFLTIAPKIYGTENSKTSTLVEGVFFSPQQIKKLKLVSLKKLGNEIFLHYRVKK